MNMRRTLPLASSLAAVVAVATWTATAHAQTMKPAGPSLANAPMVAEQTTSAPRTGRSSPADSSRSPGRTSRP